MAAKRNHEHATTLGGTDESLEDNLAGQNR
jgi:hypothetical protein